MHARGLKAFNRVVQRALVFAGALGLACASHGGIQTYSTEAAFLAAVVTPGVDSFSDLVVGGELPSPLARNAGTYTYVASSASTFFGVGEFGETWLSTNDAVASISFSQFSGGATAIGGNFFGSDIAGGFASGDVTLIASTANGSLEWTITNAVVTSFVGFVSTEPILSLLLRAEQPPTLLWPTVDNLTLAVAAVSAVPEPGTYGLVVAGLAMLGLKRRGSAFFVRGGTHLKLPGCA